MNDKLCIYGCGTLIHWNTAKNEFVNKDGTKHACRKPPKPPESQPIGKVGVYTPKSDSYYAGIKKVVECGVIDVNAYLEQGWEILKIMEWHGQIPSVGTGTSASPQYIVGIVYILGKRES